MDKAYIVTSGIYSDYHIERVFLSEEKANRFLKALNDSYAWVETYDIDDDKIDIISVQGKYLRGKMTIDKEPQIWLDGICRSPNSFTVMGNCKIYCNLEPDGNSYTLYMSKFIPKDKWQDEKSVDNFKKILTDKMAEVKSMLADGMAMDMINEILKESI